MNKKHSVYVLLEPVERNSYVRYVGMTCKTVRRRLQEHINKSKVNNNYRCRWIRKLAKDGLKPQVISLYTNLSKSEAVQAEIELIEYFLYLGANLTNTTCGGEGCLGYKHSEETKIRMSQLKTGNHTGEMNPNFGNRNSPEVRKAMALHRAKKLRPNDVTEIRKKLKAGMTHKTIAAQYNIARTTVTRIKSGVRYALVGE